MPQNCQRTYVLLLSYPACKSSAHHINRWTQTHPDALLPHPAKHTHTAPSISQQMSLSADYLYREKQPDGTAGEKCFCFRGSIKLFIIPAGMGKELARHRGAQGECWASVWHVGGAFRNHFQVLLLPNILPDSPQTQRLPFPGSPVIYQAAFQLANNLGTVSHSYQAMLGTFLTSKFPDTGQGPALLTDLLKYHSGC